MHKHWTLLAILIYLFIVDLFNVWSLNKPFYPVCCPPSCQPQSTHPLRSTMLSLAPPLLPWLPSEQTLALLQIKPPPFFHDTGTVSLGWWMRAPSVTGGHKWPGWGCKKRAVLHPPKSSILIWPEKGVMGQSHLPHQLWHHYERLQQSYFIGLVFILLTSAKFLLIHVLAHCFSESLFVSSFTEITHINHIPDFQNTGGTEKCSFHPHILPLFRI